METTLNSKLSLKNIEEKILYNEKVIHNAIPLQIQLNLDTEATVYLSYKYKIFNRDRLLKTLKRANASKTKQIFKKTHVICKQAVELAETILKKLISGKKVLLNHKYISKITECKSTDQNKNILNQLNNLFLITYHRLTIVEGMLYHYHYSFELHPKIISQLKNNGLWNTKCMPEFLRLSYKNRPDTFNKDYRSNKSISSSLMNNNKKSVRHSIKSQNIHMSKCPKINYSTSIQKQTVYKGPDNVYEKSKKNLKSKNQYFHRYNKYSKPKTLYEMFQLLDNFVCQEIRYGSQRLDFTDRFIQETVLKLGKKLEKQPKFYSLKGFISYMKCVIRYELHDAVKCSSPDFRFRINIDYNEHHKNIAKNSNQQKQNNKHQTQNDIKIPNTIFGKIRTKLIELYENEGIHYDKYWFSKLEPVINESHKTFELHSSKEFITEWIKNNCWQKIRSATASIGYTLI